MRRRTLVAVLSTGLIFGTAGTAAAQTTVAPSTVDFGKVPVNTQSAPKALTLTNGPSGAAAYANQPRTDLPFKVVSHNCPNPLPNNSSCTINVAFAPIFADPQGDFLSVAPIGSEESLTAVLKGEGVAAAKGKGKKGKKCKKKGKKRAAAAKKKGCKKIKK